MTREQAARAVAILRRLTATDPAEHNHCDEYPPHCPHCHADARVMTTPHTVTCPHREGAELIAEIDATPPEES